MFKKEITSKYCIEVCGWVEVIPENFEIISFIDMYSNLFQHERRIDLKNLNQCFELAGIEPTDENIHKIILYYNIANNQIIKNKKEEQAKHGTNFKTNFRSR